MVAAGAVAFPMVYVRTPYNQDRLFPVDQPVQFDHRHHVADDGIDCRYCHDGAEKGPYAGIPATSVCMGCHARSGTTARCWSRSVA
ncbi:MAG TPA: cytochrome c3 family protein, partial [Polyangia bacterium]